MKALVSFIYFLVDKCGGVSLLVIGALDSSFLFVPFGNDLLLIGLTARHPQKMPYYAAMAAAGSVLGCATIDWISRKGGEKTLQRLLPRRQMEYVKHQISEHVAWSLVVASIMPPPFPFTPFVAAAAAFGYPRQKLLALIAGARLVRFSALGVAAIVLGDRILDIAYGPFARSVVITLFVVTIIGSIISVYSRIMAIRDRPHITGSPGAIETR